MDPIQLSDTERKKPLSYDPSTKKFLYIADIKSGKLVQPHKLDEKSKQKLVLKRLELEEPFSIESIGAIDKDQQMEEVKSGSEVGQEIIRAEIMYLTETIKEIEKGELV